MKILDNVNISGSMNLSSNSKDQFIIGTLLENNDQNIDNLTVHANADFRNNVIIGSNSADTLIINATISGNLGNITASNLHVTGGTIYYNGMDVFASMQSGGGGSGGNNNGSGGDNKDPGYIKDIVSGRDILTDRSGSTVTLSFDTASLDGYKFLLNTSSYTPQAVEKTIYFSFYPHYNNIVYMDYNSGQSPHLKGVDYAVSDISMSINLPPVQTHLGKTFTFINATYVGKVTNFDPVGYSSSQSGLTTINGRYSVHKITFYPYSSGNYTDYVGSGKLTGNNILESYLITNNVKDFIINIGHENETDQHNFITLQAVSSSQYGYTWLIRDINDYQPYSITAF